jgi:hypothetical protein
MNGLLPIIRRVRRPLLPVEGLAGGHQADARPVVVQVIPAPEPVADAAEQPKVMQPKRKEPRGKAASTEPAQ